MAKKTGRLADSINSSAPLLSSRAPGGSFDLLPEKGESLAVYADGVQQVMMGASVTRLQLYVANGLKQEGGTFVEQREVSGWLTMPTINLLAFCQATIAHMAASAESIAATLETQRDQVRAVAELKAKNTQ